MRRFKTNYDQPEPQWTFLQSHIPWNGSCLCHESVSSTTFPILPQSQLEVESNIENIPSTYLATISSQAHRYSYWESKHRKLLLDNSWNFKLVSSTRRWFGWDPWDVATPSAINPTMLSIHQVLKGIVAASLRIELQNLPWERSSRKNTVALNILKLENPQFLSWFSRFGLLR